MHLGDIYGNCLHDAWECSGGWHTCSCGYSHTEGKDDCFVCMDEGRAPKSDYYLKVQEENEKYEEYAKEYETKDSGVREEYASGMVRDTQEGKPRFDLLITSFLPYEEQLLTRWAALMERGASKYGVSNWELANSTEELDRFRASAARHFFQWLTGEDDEDHAAAICYNISSYVSLKWKLENDGMSGP